MLPRRTLLCPLLALASTPCFAQAPLTYSVEKHLEFELLAVPARAPDVTFDWDLKGKARVKGGCSIKDRLKAFTTLLTAGVVVSRTTPTLEAGDNDNTSARAAAEGVWGYPDLLNLAKFYIRTQNEGRAAPVRDTCGSNRKRAARAKAKGASSITFVAEGEAEIFKGASGLVSRWVNRQNEISHSRRKAKKDKDPVVARLFDASNALLGEWELVRIDSTVRGNGETSMDRDTSSGLMRIDNAAPDMELYIEVGSSVVDPADRGVIDLAIENDIVTRRVLSGRFASVAGIPALNTASGSWSALIDLSDIDFDLNAPSGENVRVEIELSGAGHIEPSGDSVGIGCSLLSDFGVGFGGDDVSVRPPGDSALSFSCLHGSLGLLEQVTTTATTQLEYLVVPYIIPGAPPLTAPDSIYVRIFEGDPAQGGTLIYGGHGTPQAFEVEGADMYRVTAANPTDNTQYVNEAIIDLSAAPIVAPSTALWIEVSMIPPALFTDVRVPPSPYADSSLDKAGEYSFSSGAFTTLQDPLSARRVCLPFELFGLPVEAPPAYCTSGMSTNGCLATISANHQPSVSGASACSIEIANVEGQKLGLVFYGISGPSSAPWGFGSSFLCVKAPTQRTGTQSSGGSIGACNGALLLDWDAYMATHPGALGNGAWSVGSQAWVQGWFRDPPASKSTSLSNALELTYAP